MNWKKFIIRSISCILAILAIDFAFSCIPNDVYYDYPSFFGNKTPNKPEFQAFYYVAEDFYYNNDLDEQQDNTNYLNQENIQEWQDYTNQNLPLKEIDSLINKYPVEVLQELARGKYQNLSPEIRQNHFATWLNNNHHNEALQYIIFAKDCEPYVTTQSDWDTLSINIDSSELLIGNGLHKWQNAKDPFLKSRYAFQILRLAFYNQKYDRTISLYTQLVGHLQHKLTSLSDYRSLGLLAGANYKLGKYPLAAYLYTKVFDGTTGLKKMAMISYKWSIHANQKDDQPDTSIAQTAYALCVDNHERAVIKIMQGLTTTDKALPIIKQAYALDPKVQGIDVLVNREINKMEENYQAHNLNVLNGLEAASYATQYNSPGYDNFGFQLDSVQATYPGYIGEINQFIQKVIKENQIDNPSFWHLAAAYIGYMADNTKQMDQEMQLASHGPMTLQEQQLYKVFNILKILKNQKTITPQTENELLPQLIALDSLSIHNSDMDHNFFNIMDLLLAPKYLAQKDTIKALYCMSHSQRNDDYSYGNLGWYYDPEKLKDNYIVDPDLTDRPGIILDQMDIPALHKVQAFYESSSHSPFNTWLVKGSYYNQNTLKELEGTKYLRAFHFKQAANILKNIPTLEHLNYPFELHINDMADTVYAQDSAIITTKYTFATQMSEIQDKIEISPDNAPLLYKYALGLYGMSYYGRAANLFTYFHSTSDEYKYYKTPKRDLLPNAFQEYYGLYTAEKYFNLAARFAKTATLKAKCILGAAKCWQKRCDRYSNQDYLALNYRLYSLTNPYFKILNSNYSTNEFTKQIFNTCSYYRDFVKKQSQ